MACEHAACLGRSAASQYALGGICHLCSTDMGLGLVEYVLAVEAAFGVELPDDALRDPEPWSEAQVTDVLLRILDRECGVGTRARGPAVLDAHFCRDLNID